MRRFSETYKEIERLDEGYDEERDMKEVVTVKDKENKRWLFDLNMKFVVEWRRDEVKKLKTFL